VSAPLLVKASRSGKAIATVTPESAGWRYVGFEALRLAAGEEHRADTGQRELCVVIVCGTASVECGAQRWNDIGGRASPFEDAAPAAVYLPPGSAVRITATVETEIALCWAPAARGVAIQPFGSVVCKVAVPGRVILAALNSGVAKLPASEGRFPQVSGLTMRVEQAAAAGDRVRDVRVGGQPLDLDKTYTVAMSDYQLKGGDGYDMFTSQRVIVGPEAGPLITTALEHYVAAAGEVNPAVDGRITIVR